MKKNIICVFRESNSYSVIFGKPNNIRIRIWSFLGSRIIFVFLFSHFRKPEYYSYSYSVSFGKPNNIRIRIRSFFGTRIIFVFVFGPQNTIRSPLNLLSQSNFPQFPSNWKVALLPVPTNIEDKTALCLGLAYLHTTLFHNLQSQICTHSNIPKSIQKISSILSTIDLREDRILF